MRSLSGVGRVAAVGALVAACALVAILLFGGGRGYTVTARFTNAGQIVKGNPVQSGGVPIGSVNDIEITDDGQAEITLSIDGENSPIPVGTRAAVRQFSQSGLANRYVDLRLPADRSQGDGGPTIEDGGRIGADDTKTAVELDELFNTLDAPTRKALQDFFKGSRDMFAGRGKQARRGLLYLNPALATTSRLFGELTRDTPVLERFLVDSSTLVTALAERRDDLAALIGNLNATTRALGNQKQALANSVSLLPPFMRRANTTFVNLRAALDDVDPLVEASKPAARLLDPFLEQARGFAADAGPTVRDLRTAIAKPGAANDLIELVGSAPRLADIAMVTKQRTLSPGGHSVDVGETRGALPETAEAFQNAAPVISLARPYTPDFVGWFDDFSTTGAMWDALGVTARAHISVAENLYGGPPKTNQWKRCPGGADVVARDRSNVLSAEEQARLDCTEDHRATGP